MRSGRAQGVPDFKVNVDGPAAVPAGINCGELGFAVSIRYLVAAQEVLADRIILRFVGIKPGGVTMPDVNVSPLESRTRPRNDAGYIEDQPQWNALLDGS